MFVHQWIRPVDKGPVSRRGFLEVVHAAQRPFEIPDHSKNVRELPFAPTFRILQPYSKAPENSNVGSPSN